MDSFWELTGFSNDSLSLEQRKPGLDYFSHSAPNFFCLNKEYHGKKKKYSFDSNMGCLHTYLNIISFLLEYKGGSIYIEMVFNFVNDYSSKILETTKISND